MINKERVTLFCTGFGLDGYDLAQDQHKAGNLTDGEFMAVELFWVFFGAEYEDFGSYQNIQIHTPIRLESVKHILIDFVREMYTRTLLKKISWGRRSRLHVLFGLHMMTPNQDILKTIRDFEEIFELLSVYAKTLAKNRLISYLSG